MKSLLRWCGRIGLALLALIAVAIIAVLVVLRQGLPVTKGVVKLDGLGAPVGITRDALGIPTIDASSRVDAARALGFLHGQERFFQMDLMRRAAAGELAALAGPVALRADRMFRIHRFREAARRAVEAMNPSERRIVEAYAEGVTAGLARLGSRPFEYWLLRAKPEPWLPEDTLLVNFAMWLDLQEANGEPDLSRAVVRDQFSPEATAWLLSVADPFDAPVDGSVIEAPPMPDLPGAARASTAPANASAPADRPHESILTTAAPLHSLAAQPHPGPPAPTLSTLLSQSLSQPILDLWYWDRRFGSGVLSTVLSEADPDYHVGSNSWAVAGSRTAGGAALVANDMHLGLRLPHIWYRAALTVGGERIDGVTLPGTPAFIVGSNGRVAWGFTNSEIDTSDIVIVEPDPADPNRYLTPEGPMPFEIFQESLAVAGSEAEIHTVRWTRWGPVLGTDHRGRTIALAWTAHQRGAADLGLLRMEGAQNTGEALRFAQESGMPAQNFIAGDSAGSIGWTIAGRIPRRTGFDGAVPSSFALGTAGWDGWLAPEEVPAIIDPPDGFLWSANARVVGGAALAILGDGGYASASRAARIRDRLREMNEAKPADLLALQLDNRSLPMDFWREQIASVLTPEAAASNPGRARMRELAVQWNGDADAASAGYRLIREFRREVTERATGAVFARCREAYPSFSHYNLVTERIVRDLVTAKPSAWLPAEHSGWDSVLIESADAVIEKAGGAAALERHTWGKFNRLNMRHPLGLAIPLVGSLLDMRRAPMSGDAHAVNAQLRGHGSSERMAVAPGAEVEGILHMPGGQSGNPLSPHYRDSHPGWLRGEPTPLQPGAAVNNLLLTP
ncbi:MAG TPA: penicillin acylase family protein [Opitutaceae bacterium]|nr:penicillin acylase family protein [Opitutaceae bacterium]